MLFSYRFQLLSVLRELPCIVELRCEILGKTELELLITIHAMKQTLGFKHFWSQNLKHFHFYYFSSFTFLPSFKLSNSSEQNKY